MTWPRGQLDAAEYAWQQVRRAVLSRDSYRCARYDEEGHPRDPQPLHVHHRIARALGGGDNPANLITLCDWCHARVHPNLHASLGRRAIEYAAIHIAKLFSGEKELPIRFLGALGTALRFWGATRFREGQLEVVLAVLAGKSVLVVRPTGWGKSLCFQMPALLTPGTALVISPLKALMSDQVSALLEKWIPATFINSDIGPKEKELRYKLLSEGYLKLLYCAPERFNLDLLRDKSDRDRLVALRPPYLVVDEAHCIDRWGDDFRPDYGRLGEIRQALGNPPVLAFTATAGTEVQQRIRASLGISDEFVFVSGVDRPNIALIRHETAELHSHERYRIIARIMRGVRGKTMIFVPTVKIGEEVCSEFAESAGMDIDFYHA
ncbi:MAG TPA: DEAD/DEAH box helicase, partial [Anaerolineae bacterium]|nr:DEAD/DEAH box helicase [Anaerolineae bacterium]